MPTIFKRLEAYRKANNTPQLNKEQRQELGSYYFNQIWRRTGYWASGKIRVTKVVSKEPEGEFMAISYPKFKSVIKSIDSCIRNYHKINGIVPEPKPTKKEPAPMAPPAPVPAKRVRKRIPLKSFNQ